MSTAIEDLLKVMARLRVPSRLIAIDTPGFGGSFDPAGWPTKSQTVRVRTDNGRIVVGTPVGERRVEVKL